jgi:hypothetical protein
MDIIGATITGLRTLGSLVYPPLKKKYFDQPKIYFVFEYQGGIKKPKGLSPANDTSQPIDIMKAIYYSDIHWFYKITFRNNSEHVAYNIRLLDPQVGHAFRLAQKIDALKPLLPNNEIEHKAEFFEFYEGLGRIAAEKAEKAPEFLLTTKFILEYTNVKGTKFYTEFDGSKDEALRNQFLRKWQSK